MQFREMDQNMPSMVDQSMTDQLEQWILSRRDGSGGFLLNPNALDSFGRAPYNITHAYMIWALTNAKINSTVLAKEIANMTALADQLIEMNAFDPYFFGLVAASLYNVNRTADAEKYADIIIKSQDDDGKVSGAFTSITSSFVANLDIETTAISAIAWLNDQEKYS